MPQLSVVVPALDEAARIRETLAPLAPLRRAGAEVLLVDGGSTDGTPGVAAPLCDRVLTAPRGRASQMNAGAAAARGEALLFLHADTLLPPGAAEAVRAALEPAEWGRFDVRLDGRHPLLPLIARMMSWRSRVTGIATGDQAMFVRASVFRELGGFATMPLMEDVELSRRLRRRGRPACLRLRVTTSARRWQRHGVLRTVLMMWRLRLAYFLGVEPERLARVWARS